VLGDWSPAVRHATTGSARQDADEQDQSPSCLGRPGGRCSRRERRPEFAPDSPLEGDGFELPVREHRAMAPSHGFAAASHREGALRGAPASHGETAFRGAAGFREARRRHAVHPSRNAVLRHRAGRPVSGREARRHAVRPLRNPAGRKRDVCNTSAMMARPAPPPCEPPPPCGPPPPHRVSAPL
jgi:hypothetical protein